jgi:anti-sigma regulatory factor (Ser/Thr protein kinase)
VSHQLTIELSVDAPRQIRRCLDRYTERIEQPLSTDLRLLSSELVANAVQHSRRPDGDPIDSQLTIQPKSIRVEVIDQGEGTDPLRSRSHMPPSGLRYVELLSDRWSGGSENSFSVWLEIDTEHSLITRKR